MSRVLRRLSFWTLMPDTRMFRWDDRAIRPSSGARSSTYSPRTVASIAHDLDVSEQTIYNWRRQDRIDRGVQLGLTTAEKGELSAAKKRTAELGTELKSRGEPSTY